MAATTGLIEQLGGPPTPAVGWAAGIERILLALDEDEKPSGRDAFVAVADDGDRRRAMALATELRHAGLSAELDLAGRSLKGQLKHADRIGARRVVILEADGSRAAARHGDRRAAPGRQRQADRRDSRRRIVSAPTGDSTSEAPALRSNRYRDAWCGQVLGDRVDSEARVAGWVHRRRDHGGLIFIDLRDRTGIVQLVFHPDSSGDAFELAHGLRAEDVLTAAGTVVRRSEETVNPELATGEVELKVSGAELLADAETPPFQIEGFSARSGRTRACATATSTCAASRCATR